MNLTWFHKPGIADWIRAHTPFDPESTRGAPVSRNARWVMHCVLTPENYLDLTSTTREWLEEKGKASVPAYADAMEAQLASGRGAFPVPWLDIDWEEQEVVGHEGRHRAAAAWSLDLPAIPVVLVLRPKRYHVGEENVPLVKKLDATGRARLWAQQYTPEEPERRVWLRFTSFAGAPMGRGY